MGSHRDKSSAKGMVRRSPYGSSVGQVGGPHISAVEWSPDGRYLLLNYGGRFSFLMVAKWQDGRWWGRGTWGASYVRFVSWGEGAWFAVIGGRRPTTEDIISCINVETLERISLIPGSDAIIRWMDW